MSVFEVWAPGADAVALVVEGKRRALERGNPVPAAEHGPGPDPRRRTGSGWWRLDAPDLGPGTDYAFSLDRGPPRPDPRSAWQPYGVHGPSRVVDHRAFDWTDDGWSGFHLPSSVLYELHPGTFTPTGTLDSAIARLDHLVDLGVDAVSLTPVNAFPGRQGWGYDGVALYAVHDPYGGPPAMKRFVDACHGLGLGVILDVVYNHLGPSGNYLAEFGPYFTDRYHTPWGWAPNFDDAGSDGARRFFLDNAAMWLRDYHIDGLRLDAVHAIVDASAVHILEELAEETEALESVLGRPLWLIAESDLNDPRLLWSRERGGYGLHAQWSDDFHHALHAALTGEETGYYADFGRIEDIAVALRHAYVYARRRSGYRGRRHGRPADHLGGHRFLGYLQNHDQVGNRAIGERIDAIAGRDLQKVGAALVLTSPFVPMLFQGEEWAASTPFQYFTDHPDLELGRAIREGRRGEFAAFGWDPGSVPDPQDPATWLRSRLRWEERREPQHRDVLDWYRALIALRREWPELRDGRLEAVDTEADEAARTLRVRRGRLVVVANLGADPVERRVSRPAEVLLASGPGASASERVLRVPGRSAVVARLD
jgi:maltooligosyltrehalose trehalohydrolase